MRERIRERTFTLAGATVLPLVDAWTRFLEAARKRKIWGEAATRCHIEATAVLLPNSDVVLNDDVKIGRDAIIGTAGAGTIRIGMHTMIMHSVTLSAKGGGRLQIGNLSFVAQGGTLVAGHAGLTIGSRVMIAEHCAIHAENHTFSDTSVPMADQGMTSLGIVIEDDVWLGANVVVVDGVRIGRGSVIGAGAVVTKDIPPYSVAAGVPARVIRYRAVATSSESATAMKRE